MESPNLRVAIVDDDETVRRALRRLIASLAYTPVEFASGEAFLAELASTTFSCALIDLHMPDLNGIDVVVRMQRDGRDVRAIVITGGDEPKMRERCLKAGAAAYLIKPVERDTVFATIQSLSE